MTPLAALILARRATHRFELQLHGRRHGVHDDLCLPVSGQGLAAGKTASSNLPHISGLSRALQRLPSLALPLDGTAGAACPHGGPCLSPNTCAAAGRCIWDIAYPPFSPAWRRRNRQPRTAGSMATVHASPARTGRPRAHWAGRCPSRPATRSLLPVGSWETGRVCAGIRPGPGRLSLNARR